MEKTEFEKHLAFWEERFPGKGAALMEILQPFHGWKEEVELALPDLDSRARQAIFWRDIPGVKSFPVSHWRSLMVSFQDSLLTSFQDSLGVSSLPGLSLRGEFWRFIFYPCHFIIGGRLGEAAKFNPLLDLYLAGNLPLGFDKEGDLLVLVAD